MAAARSIKMKPPPMMISAQESDPSHYPCSIGIDSTDAYIGEKLRRVLKRETAVDGSVDMLRLDGRLLSPEDPIKNVLETGGEVTHLIEPGFSIHLTDGKAAHDWSIVACASEDCIRLRFVVTGNAQYHTEQASLVDEESSCTFMVQPAGVSLTANYHRGVTYRNCSIAVSRPFLIRRLGMTACELPSQITSSWKRQEITFGRIALDRSALALFQRLFALRSDQTWARIEAQAIGLLVIAQLFSAWRDQHHPPAVLVRLKPSERAALVRLRAEAERRSPSPVSINDAQIISGLNRNKIHYGFKEMFGMSLQRYCKTLRMQKAAELLGTSDLTITEIAEIAGFSEPTNFTASFRQHFGQLPSTLRSFSARK